MAKNGFVVAIFAGVLFVSTALPVRATPMNMAQGTGQISRLIPFVDIVQDDDDEDCRTVTTTDGSGRTITETVCD